VDGRVTQKLKEAVGMSGIARRIGDFSRIEGNDATRAEARALHRRCPRGE
jgi:hypothetical protein